MSVALGKRFCRDMLPAKRGEVYEEVFLNSEIARKLCELRIKAGLSQRDSRIPVVRDLAAGALLHRVSAIYANG